jgi:anti-sigma factor RsiW
VIHCSSEQLARTPRRRAPARPPSREALKQRRRRARRHAGTRCYLVELPEAALAEMLIDAGRIEASQSEDHAQVTQALTGVIFDLCQRWRR